jgi:hypothetical protein
MTTRSSAISTKRGAGNLGDVIAQAGAPPGSLARSSGEVFCARCRSYAIVSVVDRQGTAGAIRYVQWCSLRGVEVGCPEDCILQPAAVLLDPTSGSEAPPLR